MAHAPSLKASTFRACQLCSSLLRSSQVAIFNVVPRRSVNYLTDPANTGKHTSGVNFDTLGSWNNRMNLPINIEESIRRGQLIPMISLTDIGIASLCGRRVSNEDRTITQVLAPNLLMFGIFDGHGGQEAVDYVVDHLPGHITYWLENGETDLTVILRRSFIDVNNGFTRLLYYHLVKGENLMPSAKFSASQQQPVHTEVDVKHSPVASAKFLSPSAYSSGTTATVCLIRNGVELVVGHVGDSRALLCRKDSAVQLTQDHEPEAHTERERIERCKGRIVWSSVGRPRVNGILEMTRSIGDIELKHFGVTAEPDVRSLAIKHGSDAYVTLTTDGVHGVLTNDEIVQIVSSCIDPHEAVRLLADQALLYGSNDNCTSLVVPFGAWGKFLRGASAPKPVKYARGHDYLANRT